MDELERALRAVLDDPAQLQELRTLAGSLGLGQPDAAAPQEALWAELAEAAKGAFSQVAACRGAAPASRAAAEAAGAGDRFPAGACSRHAAAGGQGR